jgi:hypothetical protein
MSQVRAKKSLRHVESRSNPGLNSSEAIRAREIRRSKMHYCGTLSIAALNAQQKKPAEFRADAGLLIAKEQIARRKK